MRVIDGHCDVLSKMLNDPSIDFYNDHSLDVTYQRMKEVNMAMQLFAIYLPEKILNPTIEHLLQCIDIFYRKIISIESMLFIRNSEDLKRAVTDQKIGALLTLEGAEALRGNFTHLNILFNLGVRCIGITWNYANWAADGVLEPRKGGFTIKGKKLIQECNQLGIILDASHLSENGFWELHDVSTKPFIASHSNAYSICKHPRNLNNDQITALIQKDGRLGLTFVPYFIRETGQVNIADLINHLDHVCSLGGKHHVAFGSDFDGIDHWVEGLEHTGKYINLKEQLLKYYKTEDVQGFMWKNWFNFYVKYLPKR